MGEGTSAAANRAESSTARAAATSSPVAGTSCPVFPADSWWHADISTMPVHARSGDWLSHMSPGSKIHPDFGPAGGAQTIPYGIPITIVDNTHPTVPVSFMYDDESDQVGYPLGDDTVVEGGQYQSGDRHVIAVNKDTCRVYETWRTTRAVDAGSGAVTWGAGSGATWDLRSNQLRPTRWTSADAAGLPLLPGLLRRSEVVAGRVDHAIRFTTNVSDDTFSWPARHSAGSVNDPAYPPMGARFRLKSSYPIPASLHPETRVVLEAMKTYGLVLADNGAPWYFQGEAAEGWNPDMLDELKQVPASAFEAVDTSSLKITDDSMQVRTPGNGPGGAPGGGPGGGPGEDPGGGISGTRVQATLKAKVSYSSSRRGKVVARITGPNGWSGRPAGRVSVIIDARRVVGGKLEPIAEGRITLRIPRLSAAGRHTIQVIYSGSKVLTADKTAKRRIKAAAQVRSIHLH